MTIDEDGEKKRREARNFQVLQHLVLFFPLEIRTSLKDVTPPFSLSVESATSIYVHCDS